MEALCEISRRIADRNVQTDRQVPSDTPFWRMDKVMFCPPLLFSFSGFFFHLANTPSSLALLIVLSAAVFVHSDRQHSSYLTCHSSLLTNSAICRSRENRKNEGVFYLLLTSCSCCSCGWNPFRGYYKDYSIWWQHYFQHGILRGELAEEGRRVGGRKERKRERKKEREKEEVRSEREQREGRRKWC